MEKTDDLKDPKTLQIIYGAAQNKIDKLFHALDTIDAKASTLVGFVGILMVIAFGALMKGAYLILFLLGILFLFISLLLFFSAYRTRKYRFDPNLRKLREKYVSKDANEVTLQLIDNLIDTFEKFSPLLIKKAKHVNQGFIISFFGIAFLGLSVIMGEVMKVDDDKKETPKEDVEVKPDRDLEDHITLGESKVEPDPDLVDYLEKGLDLDQNEKGRTTKE